MKVWVVESSYAIGIFVSEECMKRTIGKKRGFHVRGFSSLKLAKAVLCDAYGKSLYFDISNLKINKLLYCKGYKEIFESSRKRYTVSDSRQHDYFKALTNSEQIITID